MANIVNYCKNPSFEVNVTDDWTLATTGGSAAQDATYYKIGTKSCKLTAGSSASTQVRSTTGVSVPNGATVVATVYIYHPVGTWQASKATVQIYDVTTPSQRAHVGSTVAADGAWERVTASWTNTTGGAVTCQLTCRNLWADSAGIVYFDAAQLELQSAASAYTDGAQGEGHSWAGVAHNSVSTWTEPDSTGSISIGPYMMV